MSSLTIAAAQSFGASSAVFLFEVDRPDERPLLLVEAKNPRAVALTQAVVASDGHAAPGVRLAAIFHDCADARVRSRSVAISSYADFVVDHVETRRILVDAATAHLLGTSLSDSEAALVSARLEAQVKNGHAAARNVP